VRRKQVNTASFTSISTKATIVHSNILFGWLMAFPAKRYRSNWFPIVVHNGQAFYFGFLILGLVLGQV